jgi:hypothetical protein
LLQVAAINTAMSPLVEDHRCVVSLLPHTSTASHVPNNTVLHVQVAAINTAMSALVKTITVFPKERAIVNRERTRKAYNVLPYLSGGPYFEW